MKPIDHQLPEEIRANVQRLEELWELVEDPPPNVDVQSTVREFFEGGAEDLVLTIALFLRGALEPAIRVGIGERQRILRSVDGNKRLRLFLREELGKLMERLEVPHVRGATIRVSRTKGRLKVVKDEGVDLALLPERFVKREERWGEIHEALEAGEEVPGYRLERVPGVMIS